MSADAQLGLIQRADRMSSDSLAAISENLYTAGVLDARRSKMNDIYIDDQKFYARAKSALESGVKTLQVIEKASPPPVKSRPKRAVLVLSATFLAFLASVVGIIIFDQYKDVKWKELLQGDETEETEENKKGAFFNRK
jgi:hypothetical protein